MPNKLAHFAIEANDVERAKTFYEAVFGWAFEAWGPPGFYLIHNAGVHGALQQRSTLVDDGGTGIVCSFAVSELAATVTAINAAGGHAAEDTHQIPGVGSLSEFTDTEGNRAIVIQYEPERATELGL